MKDLRVNGILNATRGLGNHGDPPLKKCVISDPYTTSVPIDQYAQILILASNGLWEVFSENEAASLVTQVSVPCYRPQRSCGKVIFSQTCVKNCVHEGEACVVRGACMAGGVHGRGVCVAGGCAAGGVCIAGGVWWGVCMARGHAWQEKTVIAVGGTHPTGMHSCIMLLPPANEDNVVGR